jgi:dihydropteroate synthase
MITKMTQRMMLTENNTSAINLKPIGIMGVLNATPDSFSGDGSLQTAVLVDRALKMLSDGADILDIGGESTRPNALPVSFKDEIQRVIPVVKEIRKRSRAQISIDTRNVETAKAALDEGVDIINDITGFEKKEMLHLARSARCKIIVMHMQGTPETMQRKPAYSNVVSDVAGFLANRVNDALYAGIEMKRIIVDPGIGFGKTLEHNLELIRNLDTIRPAECPILLGVSRKSMIGTILDLPVDQRLEGSLAAAVAGYLNGADIIRVHDVIETSRFFKVFNYVMGYTG